MAVARRSPLTVSDAAGVAARLLQAWREDPGKVTLALGLATSAAVASGFDGRLPASKLALGGALVGAVATTVASFWLADNDRRRCWTSYFILSVGMASLVFAIGGLPEFDTKVFIDICNAVL